MYTVKRMASVLSKLCQHQLESARQVQRLIDAEQAKHAADLGRDHMRSCVSGWEQSLDVFRLSSVHSMQLSNRLSAEVVAPLQDFYLSAGVRLAELAKEKKKAEKEMAQAHSAVQSEHSQCVRLLTSIEARKEEGKPATVGNVPPTPSSSGGGLLNKLQRKIDAVTVTLSTPAALNEKLYQQAAKYQVRTQHSPRA